MADEINITEDDTRGHVFRAEDDPVGDEAGDEARAVSDDDGDDVEGHIYRGVGEAGEGGQHVHR